MAECIMFVSITGIFLNVLEIISIYRSKQKKTTC